MEKKTPLYDMHVKYGGKIVPFAGYLLPVQYGGGVIAEHMAVRNSCGMFDVSHMGEFFLEGHDALENLNMLMTNDFTNMADGQARYSPMCNEKGGTVDDLIVYKRHEDFYMIVVNAANKDKDFNWIKDHLTGHVHFTDMSDKFAQIAIQGPAACNLVSARSAYDHVPVDNYTACFDAEWEGIPCVISRTGYTGEDGLEIYLRPERACEMWELLMDAGRKVGLTPCGLGARDTLRLEACMPLYGHELADDISPKEAGLGYFIKMDKPDFIGKQAMLAQQPLTRKRVGLKVTGRGIIREHMDLYVGDKKVGFSTSGSHLPYVGAPMAMAMVDMEYTAKGTVLEADVRGRRVTAEVVATPFYKRK